MPKQVTRPLSKKNKKMVQVYMSDPGITKTEAYKRTHKVAPTTKITSLHQQAAHTFRNPLVKIELAKYSEEVEDAIIGTVQDWKKEDNSRKREIAMQNAQYIHDKIHGRAKQQIDMTQTSITLSLDLTGLGAPTED